MGVLIGTLGQRDLECTFRRSLARHCGAEATRNDVLALGWRGVQIQRNHSPLGRTRPLRSPSAPTVSSGHDAVQRGVLLKVRHRGQRQSSAKHGPRLRRFRPRVDAEVRATKPRAVCMSEQAMDGQVGEASTHIVPRGAAVEGSPHFGARFVPRKSHPPFLVGGILGVGQVPDVQTREPFNLEEPF